MTTIIIFNFTSFQVWVFPILTSHLSVTPFYIIHNIDLLTYACYVVILLAITLYIPHSITIDR